MRVPLLIALMGGALALAQEPKDWIGLRFDSERVLFFYQVIPDNDPEWKSPPGTQFLKPQATYMGGYLKASQPRAGSPSVGARYEVLLSGTATAEVEIESYVARQGCADFKLGAVARVVRNQEGFRKEPGKYYVLRLPSGSPAAAPWRFTQPRAVTLDAAALRAKLDPYLREHLPANHRLVAAAARFRMDAQAVPIDASGTIRYFVRALWDDSKGTGLLMAAWLRPDLSVEFVERQWSDKLRVFGTDSMNPDLDNLPKILNVIEENGAPGIMRFERGYEGFSIVRQQYSPEGLVPVGNEYGYGC